MDTIAKRPPGIYPNGFHLAFRQKVFGHSAYGRMVFGHLAIDQTEFGEMILTRIFALSTPFAVHFSGFLADWLNVFLGYAYIFVGIILQLKLKNIKDAPTSSVSIFDL